MYIKFNFYTRVCVKEVSRNSYSITRVFDHRQIVYFSFVYMVIMFFFLPFCLGRRTDARETDVFCGVCSTSENVISES